MPNIKSAKKRVKVIKAKTLKNKMIKSNLKTVLKNANTEDAAAIQLAINEGVIDAERLRMRPAAQWYTNFTVAELSPEVEEAPIEHELDE